MLSAKDKLKLICVALGIIVTYTLMGIAVEKLFKSDYNGEKFDFAVAYNVVQTFTPTIISKSIIFLLHNVQEFNIYSIL